MGSTKASGRAGFWVAIPLAGLLGGCQAACPFPGQTTATRLELFFGRAIPGGGRVSDTAWQDFATRILTPAFPDGFSVMSAAGQWLEPQRHRIVREDSFVVLVLGQPAPSQIAQVTRTYQAWYHQEAVGVVSSPACAAF